MIYFIRPVGEIGPIRIGYASNPSRRLADHQRGSPVPIEIFALQDGPPRTEKRLHFEFRDCHLRGEWFRPHPDLLAHAAKHAVEPMRYEGENPFASGRYPDPGRHFAPFREAVCG